MDEPGRLWRRKVCAYGKQAGLGRRCGGVLDLLGAELVLDVERLAAVVEPQGVVDGEPLAQLTFGHAVLGRDGRRVVAEVVGRVLAVAGRLEIGVAPVEWRGARRHGGQTEQREGERGEARHS